MKEFKKTMQVNSLHISSIAAKSAAQSPPPAPTIKTLNYLDGGTYVGEIENGLPHGKGKKTSISRGYTYEGDFVMGFRHGIGKITYADGNIYEGEVVQGSPHGKGKKTYVKTGNAYEGDFVQGTLQGKGKMIYSDGNIYEGEYEKGVICGKGKMTYADGDIYEGEFVNGRPAFSHSTSEMTEMITEKYAKDVNSPAMNATVNLDGSYKPEALTAKKLTTSQISAHAKDLTEVTKTIWKNRKENKNLSEAELMETFK